MGNDAETLYRKLGRLIGAMPDLTEYPVTTETHLWVARAYALVAEVGNLADPAVFSVTVNNLGTTGRINAAHELKAIVYRAFAVSESKAPPGAAGAFIPVGDSFDAFAALAKVLQTATQDVLIVDPYLDETVLTDFAGAIPQGVAIRLMADEAQRKPTLEPAAKRWIQQYGSTRPLAVRLAAQRALHDRAIFVDRTGAWTLTQSLKDFAKRSPAEIIRADETAAMKISAYEDVWAHATIVL